MGSITTHRNKGVSNVEFFTTGPYPVIDLARRTILAHATVEHVFYAAVRDNDTREVWALVVITSWAPNDSHNFCYKSLDETCGPGDHKAPLTVLDALTPTTHEHANEWRATCRDYQAHRAWVRANVTPGSTVTLNRTHRFTNGFVSDTFTYQIVRRRQCLTGPDGTLYKVPKWRDQVVVPTRELAGN